VFSADCRSFIRFTFLVYFVYSICLVVLSIHHLLFFPTTIWISMNTQWTNEQMNKWTNEQMNKWTNEQMNKWTNEQIKDNMQDSCHLCKWPVTVNGADIANTAHLDQFLAGQVRSKQARQALNAVKWMPWGSKIRMRKNLVVTWR
jgi:hypothetical protein